MKRILSLTLALVMVLGTFTAVFAAEPTVEEAAGAFLEKVGVLLGDDEGDLLLEENLERRDAVILLSRLLDQEEVAKEFPTSEESPSWTDARTDAYYVPFFAWAEANKYFEGNDDGTFAPREAITAQEYALVLLRALGYEASGHDAWKAALETAKELGLLVDVEVKDADKVLRGQMAVMTLNALGTKINDSDKTLAKELGIEMPVPAGATKIEEVYADNLKEIVVVFDGPVEEESAKTITNYKVDGITLTRASAVVLSEDGTEVTVQLRDNSAVELKNQKKYELTISGVKSLNDSYVFNETIEFKPLDTKVPEVVDIKALGNKLITVTFDEPVKKGAAENRTNYKLNGYILNGKLELSKDLRTVSVRLYSAMKTGVNKLSVSDVEDIAGMKIVNVYDREFEVVEDKVAPEKFTVLEATLESAKVEFNEAVDSESLRASNIYWLDANGRKVVAESVSGPSNDHTVYTITFSERNKLPARETTLYIEKAKDYSGNTADKLSVPINAVVDTERPELKEIDMARSVSNDKYLGETDKLDLTFSKAIDLDSIKGTNRRNITVKDENGKIVAVARDAQWKDTKLFPNTVRVTLTNKLTEGKTYTVEVKNVIDTTYLKNMMIPTIETLVVPNISGPNLESAHQETINKKVYVVFDKEMAVGGEGSVLDNDKYMVKIAGGNWTILDRRSEIEPGYDNKSVIITLDGELKGKSISHIRVSLVEDAFGNRLNNLTQEVELSAPTATKIKKAELVAKDQIKLTFDRELLVIDEDNFTVNLSVVDYIEHDKDVVKVYLKSDIYSTVGLTVTTNSTNTKDIIDKEIKAESGKTVNDKVAPTLFTNSYGETTSTTAVYTYEAVDYVASIEFQFTEDVEILAGISEETAANDLIVYVDYVNNDSTQLVAGVDYTIAVSGDKVTVKFLKTDLDVNEVTVSARDITKYIVDKAGNSIEDFNEKYFEVNGIIEETKAGATYKDIETIEQ